MQDRIYPTWEQIEKQHDSLTEGEVTLLKYLDKHLPKDPEWNEKKLLTEYRGWLIFSQPFLNGSRPDVIIFNPYVGMVIYEVKDWDLDNYHWQKKSKKVSDNGKEEYYYKLFVSDGRGSYPIKSPISQVNHYKEKIIGQLAPLIGELADKRNAGYGLVKTALYFHKETTKNCRAFFNEKLSRYELLSVFGNDHLLNRESFIEIVPDYQRSRRGDWDLKWNTELMFWLKPPYHSIEQGTLVKLKHNQVKLGTPKEGYHRVRGVAGSGKSLSLAYRAAQLASQNKDVLIITFNITLWHYIKDMIARTPFNFKWSNFTFNHFHGLCKDVLNKCGKEWPKSPKPRNYTSNEDYERALDHFFRFTVPGAVINAIGDKYTSVYDVILIDEGQDYEYEWYAMLDQYFITEHVPELVVVCDKRQNVYDRNMDWIDKRTKKPGLEKFIDNYINLTFTYRMTDKITKITNDFITTFNLNQELKLSKDPSQDPTLFETDIVTWTNIVEEEWLSKIHETFESLKEKVISPSDIVILVPDRETGLECVKSFEEKRIKTNHVFENEEDSKYHRHKKAFWMGDSRLKLSTIHSFKGWEILSVIIYIPKSNLGPVNKMDSVVYTALTRSKQNLIVFNANDRYNSFGKKYSYNQHEN